MLSVWQSDQNEATFEKSHVTAAWGLEKGMGKTLWSDETQTDLFSCNTEQFV